MRRTAFFVAVSLSLVCFSQPIQAEITWTGDIDPADPTAWTNNTHGYIAKTSDGTIVVDDDSDLSSRNANIGHESGSTGQVTVDGVGSTWTNNFYLYVGWLGAGTLNITGGTAVTATAATSAPQAARAW